MRSPLIETVLKRNCIMKHRPWFHRGLFSCTPSTDRPYQSISGQRNSTISGMVRIVRNHALRGEQAHFDVVPVRKGIFPVSDVYQKKARPLWKSQILQSSRRVVQVEGMHVFQAQAFLDNPVDQIIENILSQ